MFESSIRSLPLIGRGKVRDIYAVGDDKLLIVTTDRLSAYDVILPTPVPEKGRVLTELANFWFGKLASIVAWSISWDQWVKNVRRGRSLSTTARACSML